MNKVTVKIQGAEYQMTGDKPVEKMKQIADYVDSEMSTIAEANSRLSISAVSILTALNIADLLFECSEENQEIAKELEELQANAETGINSEAAKELEEKIALKDQEIEELKNGVESKNSEQNGRTYGNSRRKEKRNLRTTESRSMSGNECR